MKQITAQKMLERFSIKKGGIEISVYVHRTREVTEYELTNFDWSDNPFLTISRGDDLEDFITVLQIIKDEIDDITEYDTQFCECGNEKLPESNYCKDCI